MELYITTPTVDLPSANRINGYLSEAGVRVTVPALDWDRQSGYLPMLIGGASSGVEVNIGEASESGEVTAAFGISPGAASRVISLRWGGDLTECAGALALASAVAHLTGGRILDPQDGGELAEETAMDQARECLKGT